MPGKNGAADATGDRFSNADECERKTENERVGLIPECEIGAGIARWAKCIGASGSIGEPGGGD